MRRLLTLPGVNFVTAAALLAAIGDIRRFPTARQLVSYLGLDPRVRQSGTEPARHGRISKQGPGEPRHVLVEAAWHATRTPGPLRALHQRIASRRGGNIATVSVARKLSVPRMVLVVNNTPMAFDFADVKERVETTYECEVAAVLPHSDELMTLSSGGVFALRYPDHPVTALYRQVATCLTA